MATILTGVQILNNKNNKVMSSTSYITLHLLVKLWLLGVVLYTTRSAASELHLRPRSQFFLYLVAGGATYAVLELAGVLYGVVGHGDKRLRLDREESELVREYIKYRREGETLGVYLMRVEGEEEEMIKARGNRLRGSYGKLKSKRRASSRDRPSKLERVRTASTRC